MNGAALAVDDVTPLSAQQARALTDEIRQTLRVGHDLIVRAFAGRAWTALGYESWDAYCAGEFAEARMVRLDREQRREIVAEMRQAGMSTRAIASGLGVPQRTVADDVASERFRSDGPMPSTVTSLDGRQRPAAQPPRETVQVDVSTGEIVDTPAAQPERPRQNRRPLTEAFWQAAFDLSKKVESIHRLTDDDRFPHNAEKVAAAHRNDLLRYRDLLTEVIDRLPEA